MSKKKQDIESMLSKIINQEARQDRRLIANLVDNDVSSDYFHQIEENERQYEQEYHTQTSYNLAVLAVILQNDRQEIHKIKKLVKELESEAGEHTVFECNIRKSQKKHSKKIDKLFQIVSEQEVELKRCNKQIEQLTKTICLMASYSGIGNTSGDLRKIQKKLIKEIERGNKMPCLLNFQEGNIIEGNCREL